MHESATLVLAIIGAIATWTGTVVAAVVWLTGKFRYLEKTVYREMEKHRREDDAQFRDHGTKIQRLELRTFGFTSSSSSNIPPVPLIEDH